MILKYGVNVEKEVVASRLKSLVNQTYKLLPSREQGANWEKPLETILEELAGMSRILGCDYSEIFFPLLNKMEGLYLLTAEDKFSCYRRTIFECLQLMNKIMQKVCHQN